MMYQAETLNSTKIAPFCCDWVQIFPVFLQRGRTRIAVDYLLLQTNNRLPLRTARWLIFCHLSILTTITAVEDYCALYCFEKHLAYHYAKPKIGEW